MNIIKSACIFYGWVQSRRSHLLLIFLLCIFYIILSHFMICISIHTPIYFCIHFTFFYHFCCLHILHELSLCNFFFKFIFLKVHIFDEIISSMICNVTKGLMNLLWFFLIFWHSVATDPINVFLGVKRIFLNFFRLIFEI